MTIDNGSVAPVSIDPARTFTIFYGTRRHALERSDTAAGPVAPSAQAMFTLHFRVPAHYRYPLLWFAGAGGPPTTVVLRGAGIASDGRATDTTPGS